MTYHYETQKKNLFTEQGLQLVIDTRENIKGLLNSAGAFTVSALYRRYTGDSWDLLAAIDYIEQQGFIRCVSGPFANSMDTVYTKGKVPFK